MYTYEYPRPALTVDCVLFGYDTQEQSLNVLLIERLNDPYAGYWAFPGGFVDMNETAETAAHRELEEETKLKGLDLKQFQVFSKVDRDPRGRVVSIGYWALVKPSDYHLVAASDARQAKWFDIKVLPQLAFDHQNVFEVAISKMRRNIYFEPIGLDLLPEKFTFSEFKTLYEILLNQELESNEFDKKMKEMRHLIALNEGLFTFDKSAYHSLKNSNRLIFSI